MAESDIFQKASRRCKTCGKTVDMPQKILLGMGTQKEYCSCGGELERTAAGSASKDYNKDAEIWKTDLE